MKKNEMTYDRVSEMEAYFDRLWPICRSLSGDGVRRSFEILKEIIPLKLVDVPTGKSVFDWVVPAEWNVSDAYIIDPEGRKVIDFQKNNLHLMSYSTPLNQRMSWNELQPHLHYHEELFDAIPYRTTYYKKDWGFCVSKNQYDLLSRTGEYTVVIESSLSQGAVTYGDLVLKGDSEEEVFFSSYICHPSMANNELSGPLLLAFLYDELRKLPNRKYTYRFLLAPETIGSIIYLHKHGNHLSSKLKAGYILTCTGLDQPVVYKRSRQGNAYNDRVVEHTLLKFSGLFDHEAIDFFPFGSDERQYCSPGFDLPVGSITRGMYGRYPEYHTSLDNKSLLSFDALNEMLNFYMSLIGQIEEDEFYQNLNPRCEPQLGKRGVYPNTGGKVPDDAVFAMMWVLNMSDGSYSLREIAERSRLEHCTIVRATEKLVQCKLLKKI